MTPAITPAAAAKGTAPDVEEGGRRGEGRGKSARGGGEEAISLRGGRIVLRISMLTLAARRLVLLLEPRGQKEKFDN